MRGLNCRTNQGDALVMTIAPGSLRDGWPIENPADYTVHFATYRRGIHDVTPLCALRHDYERWVGWQQWRGTRNRFPRDFIFSLARIDAEGKDIWLFGGVFQVLRRHEDGYVVELVKDKYTDLVGRLKLRSPYRARNRYVRMENQYDDLEVLETLSKPYDAAK